LFEDSNASKMFWGGEHYDGENGDDSSTIVMVVVVLFLLLLEGEGGRAGSMFCR
jgi:hypothetical protein